MSQEGEDYIQPIFPANSEENFSEDIELEREEEGEGEGDNDFTLVGGAARRLWPTIDQYKTKFLEMFEKGYKTLTGGVYLPSLSITGLVPTVNTGTGKVSVLPKGDTTNTTFKNYMNNKATYTIKEIKSVKDMLALVPTPFPKNTVTTPVFYLSLFMINALKLAAELEGKVTISEKEKNDLYLLAEIIVRLYILSFINIFTQYELCVERPTKLSLYERFVSSGANSVYEISELLTAFQEDLLDEETGIKQCLFGKDTPIEQRKLSLEALYDLLKDFGIVYFFNDVLNVKREALKDYSKTYFFDSMENFLEKMIGASTGKAKNGAPGLDKIKSDCELLKAEIDKLPEADRKALTPKHLEDLFAVNNLFTKTFIKDCLEDFGDETMPNYLFPKDKYGFAAVKPENNAPPPPPPPPYTEAQKAAAIKLIQESLSFPELSEFYVTRSLPKEPKEGDLTRAILNKIIEDLNKEKGLSITIKTPAGAKVPFKTFTRIEAPPDGWCFYHSINRQLAADNSLLPINLIPKNKKATPEENTKTAAFIKQIQEWIRAKSKDELKAAWKRDYDLIYQGSYGKDVPPYDTYLEGMAEEKNHGSPLYWADPDFGVALGAASVKQNDIEIYELANPFEVDPKKQELVLVKKYTVNESNDAMKEPVGASASASSASVGRSVKLFYVSKNHYDILYPKAAAAAEEEEEDEGLEIIPGAGWTEEDQITFKALHKEMTDIVKNYGKIPEDKRNLLKANSNYQKLSPLYTKLITTFSDIRNSYEDDKSEATEKTFKDSIVEFNKQKGAVKEAIAKLSAASGGKRNSRKHRHTLHARNTRRKNRKA